MLEELDISHNMDPGSDDLDEAEEELFARKEQDVHLKFGRILRGNTTLRRLLLLQMKRVTTESLEGFLLYCKENLVIQELHPGWGTFPPDHCLDMLKSILRRNKRVSELWGVLLIDKLPEHLWVKILAISIEDEVNSEDFLAVQFSRLRSVQRQEKTIGKMRKVTPI